MEIKTIGYRDPETLDFAKVPYLIYRDDPQWLPPSLESSASPFKGDNPFFSYGEFQGFMAMELGNAVGRVAALINPRLRQGDDPVGTVGYYEVVEDPELSDRLLGAAIEWLYRKGIRKVWGPMNFSIFHGYRFMTRGFERRPFFGEPYNKPYYPQFFLRNGFRPFTAWHSWDLTRDQMRDLYQSLGAEDDPGETRKMGVHIVPFDPARFEDEMARLHRIITLTFNETVGYTELSYEEFGRLYGGLRHMIKRGLTVFAVNERRETIGFFVGYPESSGILRGMRNRSGLGAASLHWVAKRLTHTVCLHSLGIIKEERKKGIMRNKIMTAVLRECLRYQRGIFALIKAGGSNIFQQIAGPTREYCLYERDL